MSRFTTLRLLVAALAATAVLSVACGGNDNGSKAPDSNDSVATVEKKVDDVKANDAKDLPLDPCKLLTLDEVSAAIGTPANDGKAGGMKDSPIGQAICTWSGKGDTAFNALLISVERTKDFAKQLKDQGYTAQKLYDEGKKLYPDAKNVSGIGKSAFRAKNSLHVLLDGATFNVDLTMKGDASDAQLVEIAQKVAGRLK